MPNKKSVKSYGRSQIKNVFLILQAQKKFGVCSYRFSSKGPVSISLKNINLIENKFEYKKMISFDLKELNSVEIINFNNETIATLDLSSGFKIITANEGNSTLPQGKFESFEDFLLQYFEHNKEALSGLQKQILRSYVYSQINNVFLILQAQHKFGVCSYRLSSEGPVSISLPNINLIENKFEYKEMISFDLKELNSVDIINFNNQKIATLDLSSGFNITAANEPNSTLPQGKFESFRDFLLQYFEQNKKALSGLQNQECKKQIKKYIIDQSKTNLIEDINKKLKLDLSMYTKKSVTMPKSYYISASVPDYYQIYINSTENLPRTKNNESEEIDVVYLEKLNENLINFNKTFYNSLFSSANNIDNSIHENAKNNCKICISVFVPGTGDCKEITSFNLNKPNSGDIYKIIESHMKNSGVSDEELKIFKDSLVRFCENELALHFANKASREIINDGVNGNNEKMVIR